jgi:lipopolysaccharide export system permease protein
MLLARSLVAPVCIAMAALCGLALLGVAARMAADPVVRALPTSLLAPLALALLTPLLSVVLPLGFFAGLVAAVVRLEADGTVEAARCLGASPLRVMIPSLVVALLVALATGMAGAWGEPWGRHRARAAIAELSGPDLVPRAGPLAIETGGTTLGAARIEADGSMRDVLLWSAGGDEVVLAPRGEIRLADGALTAALRDGELHLRVDGGGYARVRFERYEVTLELPLLESRPGREPFELAPAALLAEIDRRRGLGKEVRFHELALHRRMAIPLAVPLLALVAWRLGRGRHGAGVTRGVLAAVGVGLAYYLALRVGDHLLRQFHWPALAAGWLATAGLLPVAGWAWWGRWRR